MKEATVEYLPRDQFQPFHHRKQRSAIIVAQRRATVATINDLIARALYSNKPDGRYAFVAPLIASASALPERATGR
jgi:hypothetical protein